MSIRFLKIAIAIITVAVISMTAVLFMRFTTAEDLPIRYDLAGWMWSDNYGWISLNSDNASLINQSFPSSTYKVVLNSADNSVSGWGWSSNVGWVCFGSTCNNNDFGTSTPNGGWQANFSPQGNLVGWAKIISLKDDGWLHLGMGASVPTQSGQDCYDCRYDTSTPPKLTGCNICFTATKFNNINIPDSEIPAVVGGSGGICSNCSNCFTESYRSICGSCSSCNSYGGYKDSQTGGLVGWGWNGNSGAVSTTGAGWVQYNALGGESGIVYPWVQTLYGPIFSGNAVRQKSVVSGSNATYCIFAKDVYNFKSSNCANQKFSNVNINFPQEANGSYKNILGRLDLAGLTSVDRRLNGVDYNKYGNILDKSWPNTSVTLNNKVYVIDGDLIINSPLMINNASLAQRGNGIVIINGDLLINSDVVYQQSINLTDLKQLASVAWIVKGDVIIDPAVKQISGAFLVLGQENTNCYYENGASCSDPNDYPRYQKTGYGIFFSGASNNNPLTVYGLLMAKAFDLRRLYSSITQGSEKVIYDGRLLANPPPGLKSLIEGLPLIRDFNF